MTTKILKNVFTLGIVVSLLSFDMPKGWFKAGSKPSEYEMGTDKNSGHDGKNAATIQSISPVIDGFGTLMQDCKPGKYLGKRVRMTGYVKSKDVNEWAGLWFRVDGDMRGRSLSFDNMQNRAIKGTTGWKKYEIVLDVPQNATNLAYGALLAGTGQIWFDDINFEIVGNEINITGPALNEPANLDFKN